MRAIRVGRLILLISLSAIALAAGPVVPAHAVKAGLNGRIAFSSNADGDAEIYTMKLDRADLQQLTHNTWLDEDPSWSPDSTALARVAFSSQREGNAEIYVMNADGSGQTNLTNDPASDRSPAWSPDGAKIAFTSNRDGDNEIYTMNSYGTDVAKITSNTANDDLAAWSPDGTKIAFTSSRGGNAEIYTMNADGSSQTDLTNVAAADQEPTWSPSGAKIAFATNRDVPPLSNYEIYTMNTDGSSQTRVTSTAAPEHSPAYSPNGTKLALTSNQPGNNDVFLGNIDGSGFVNLTQAASSELYPDIQTEAAPDTNLTSSPASPTNSTEATFEFTASEPGTTFQCQLDGSTISSCTSPKTYTGLGEGSHTVQVTAIDGAGNSDPTPATESWTVDTTEPQTTIGSGPAHNSNSNRAAFSFTSDDPAASFQCRVDVGSWSSCSSPDVVEGLADGTRGFEVRAVDQAGNLDSTPASYSWGVDTGAPDTTIDEGPGTHSRLVSAAFTFHASEDDVAFECSVDGESFAPCSSPEPINGLIPGTHTFRVRATDRAGNIDPDPATYTWAVDRRPPRVSVAFRGAKKQTRMIGGNNVVMLRRSQLRRLRGGSSDAEGVHKVKIALRISRPFESAGAGRCRFLSLKTGRRVRHLCKRNFTDNVSGTTAWSLDIPDVAVRHMHTTEEYVLYVRATDFAGNNAFERLRFRLRN